MVARPLTEREALPYLVVFVLLSTLVCYVPQSLANIWDGLGVIWSLTLAVFGTIYIYRLNGGASGQHFMQRYFAIGWVVSLRCLVFILLISIIYFLTLDVLGTSSETTTWHDFLLYASSESFIYWRIGHHVGNIASRASVS
jgi:hypothetical protein